jgi:DNA-binding transcriptional LysR family regulator
MLDPRDLRCFVAVYELRGFARAGRAMDVVQSSVSARVRRLEQAIGAPLFERNSRSVTPTGKGELLYRHARRVLAQLDALESRVKLEKPAA